MDLVTQRHALNRRLAELNNRLQSIERDLDERPDPDVEERSAEREDDEVLEQLGLTGLAEIDAIHAALKRMDNAVYGICVSCGETISDERLLAVPTTPKCRHCARK